MSRRRSVAVASGILGTLGLLVALGPLVAGRDAVTSYPEGATPLGVPVAPGAAFLLGADRLFRDVLARLAWATRLSLATALLATALSAGAGTAFGLVAGWRAGDAVGRVLSVLLDAAQGVPFALMLLVIGATAAPTTPLGMAVTLAVFGWVGFARAARARALTLRREPYIDAARALGQTPARILLQHVAPQLTPTLAPLAAMALPQFVLAESTLAYLGLGLPPPTPTLGQMVAEGQETLAVAPWLLAAPAAVLVALGVAFFLLADGLGEAP